MSDRFTILVHGGTVPAPSRVTDRHLELVRAVVSDARDALAGGGGALDVVVDAIARLEDSGLLNAGRGSARSAAGVVETDASVMLGATGRSGAVAAMQRLKNPIRAARIVLERTSNVLFAGATGEETLLGLGAEAVDPDDYYAARPSAETIGKESGTVGAVALDRHGNLAAGTSTGGYFGKPPGRVGDSPIVGASTFANERVALSATGLGEAFVRRMATKDIADRAEYLGVPLKEAADYVVHALIGEAEGADGAIVAIGLGGEIVLSAVNVFGALHGYASESRDVTVGIEVG